MRTAVVFVGGPHRRRTPGGRAAHAGSWRAALRRRPWWSRSDSGLHLAEARSAGRSTVVVGDMDSVDPTPLDAAVAAGVTRRAPPRRTRTRPTWSWRSTAALGGGQRAHRGARPPTAGRLDHLLGGSGCSRSAPRYAPLARARPGWADTPGAGARRARWTPHRRAGRDHGVDPGGARPGGRRAHRRACAGPWRASASSRARAGACPTSSWTTPRTVSRRRRLRGRRPARRGGDR